jgi:AraC-like DNA-binding protein
MIVWGPGLVSARHKHHSIQLVMAIEGRLRIRSGPKCPWMECGAAVVDANAPHEVDAADAQVVLAFADPKSDVGAALRQAVQQNITLIQDDIVASWRQQLGGSASLTSSRIEPWVRKSLLSVRRTPQLHPKVRRVLEVLREELATDRRMSLKRMAGIAGLSESRFMHVFTESVGVPIRPYIRWLRLQRACGEMMKGATVTQAAHRAGFADAAHLSRTARRLMGTKPRDLIRQPIMTRTAFIQRAPSA